MLARAPPLERCAVNSVAKNSVGKEPDWWPRDPFGYVFLARLVEKLGAALHSDWTGTEATTEDIDPLPRNLKDALFIDRQRADILLNRYRSDLKRPDFIIGRGVHEFSDEHWKIAHDEAQRLHEQGRAPLHRLQATQSEIVKRNEAGNLELRIQSRNGGPWRDFQRDWWNKDKWRLHFDRCRIDPEYPNGDRPSWMRDDNDHWIFATLQSFETLLKLKRPGGARVKATASAQLREKPTSDTDFADFVEKFTGPWTESALTAAVKHAGMNVTRVRIRAALPDRERGRPSKSPK
jgi:hypothetical protein